MAKPRKPKAKAASVVPTIKAPEVEALAKELIESQLAGMTVTMLADGQSVEMTGEQFEAGLDRIASMTPEEIAAFSDDEAPGVQFTEHAAAGGGAE